jgi:hypothetical protein
VDNSGNVYICDHSSTIRKVNAAGIITTIAGTGVWGMIGDGGPATAAQITVAQNAAMYGNGDIYFSDRQTSRIRRISARPYFTGGGLQSITACGTDTLNVDTLLAANDTNSGNTEYWGLVWGPFHGTAAAAYSAVSTGGLVIPAGLTYVPAPGFTGVDTFRVSITDSVISDTTTIYVTVQAPLHVGAITGADTVCKGKQITLADTTAGGAWSVSNGNAFVSGGSVQGLAPGTDTVLYTVSNSCGPVAAKYAVAVKACTNEVGNVALSKGITVYPNPTGGAITLSFAGSGNEQAHITITDLVGGKVKEFTCLTGRPVTLSLDVPAGVYFVGADTGGARYNAKIVVAGR